jgi:hypothetical protein
VKLRAKNVAEVPEIPAAIEVLPENSGELTLEKVLAAAPLDTMLQ